MILSIERHGNFINFHAESSEQLTTARSCKKDYIVSYLTPPTLIHTPPHSYTPIPTTSTNGNLLLWFSSLRSLKNISNGQLHREHSLAFEGHSLDRDMSRETSNLSFPSLTGSSPGVMLFSAASIKKAATYILHRLNAECDTLQLFTASCVLKIPGVALKVSGLF